MTENIPKEAKVVSLLLNSSNVAECEPNVINFIIDFMHSI